MLIKLFLAVLICKAADGLMCYECSDTSDDDGRNKCQTYVRTMRYYRRQYEETGTLLNGKYVKDCTDFTIQPGADVFCAVTSVESQGRVKSFIRGCSDGQQFFEAEYNDIFRSSVIADNQTTCHYNNGFVACVAMCNTDFCNGPSSAGLFRPSLLLMVMTCVFIIFQQRMFSL